MPWPHIGACLEFFLLTTLFFFFYFCQVCPDYAAVPVNQVFASLKNVPELALSLGCSKWCLTFALTLFHFLRVLDDLTATASALFACGRGAHRGSHPQPVHPQNDPRNCGLRGQRPGHFHFQICSQQGTRVGPTRSACNRHAPIPPFQLFCL